MNLAIRKINSEFVSWNTEGSFLKDAHPDLKADFILANPPFNQKDWGIDILQDDARWKLGVPPNGNANYGWMMHMLYHLAYELGLTEEEFAFYSVLNQNDSTKMIEDSKMKELIHRIVAIIRKNATVDWSKRSDVRAKLRLTVRKILIEYAYPPDLARMEADRVIEQGETLADSLSKN